MLAAAELVYDSSTLRRRLALAARRTELHTAFDRLTGSRVCIPTPHHHHDDVTTWVRLWDPRADSVRAVVDQSYAMTQTPLSCANAPSKAEQRRPETGRDPPIV